MNLRRFMTAACFAVCLPVTAVAAPVPEQLIGRVTLRSLDKLDARANKELAGIANRIKKNRNKGAIVLTGDVASAGSQDDYITKAVFTARAVQRQLAPLLADRYQIFITAALYDAKNKAANNSVAIHLYPYELKVMDDDIMPFLDNSRPLPEETIPVSEKPVVSGAPPTAWSGSLTPPPADDGAVEVTAKQELQKEHSEDPALAAELVNRAKARAAARARQLELNK